MDVNSPVRNVRSRKVSEEWNKDESKNRIGCLPDEILQRIISFLPTKDALRTCVLSKRWEYLWMSITDIDFKEGDSENRRMFMNFVERVLVLRDCSDIRKFSLTCDVLSDGDRVNAWISAAVRHNVQDLSLHLFGYLGPFALPISLFTSESLLKMELWGNYNLKLPSVVHFPNLKNLSFMHFVFSDRHSTQQLFSGCPALETLTLSDCMWDDKQEFCITVPMLRKLYIHLDRKNESNGCQVTVSGTHLQNIIYAGEFCVDYCLKGASKLMAASVDTKHTEVDLTSRGIVCNAHKLLKGLAHAKILMLSANSIEVLNAAEDLSSHVPVFHTLYCLLFTRSTVNFYSGAILRILHNSPCMTYLEFEGGLSLETREKEDWMLDPVPPCFSTNLKTIKISDFRGTKAQLQVIKILLKNATVLEIMVICCNTSEFDCLGVSKKQEVQDELQCFPRGSKKCKIVFL